MKQEMGVRRNDRLRRAREMRQWTQLDLADKVETTPITIGRWERGETIPSKYYKLLLCKVFGLSEPDLGLTADEADTPFLIPAETPFLLDPCIPLPFPQKDNLVGRDAICSDLQACLQGMQSMQLVALTGLPGVGKTTLATALCYDQQLRESFQGILWAGLGQHADVQNQLARWAGLLGIAQQEHGSVQQMAMALHAAIGSRRILFVLDDAWTINDAMTLKVGGPFCAYLLTTRFPTLATQFAHKQVLLVEALTEEQALELLQQLAPEAVKAHKKLAGEVVHSAGGLPLALELIGHWLSKQSSSGQLRRMQQALEHLADAKVRLQLSEPRALLDHRPFVTISLEKVIGMSVKWLNAELQVAFYALSVFPAEPNSFPEDAAVAVGCPVEVLDHLVDVGLVQVSRSEQGEQTRYSVHQTLVDYASLDHHETEAEKRLVAYFADFVEKYGQAHGAPLTQEIVNIFQAIEVAYRNAWQADLVRLVCNVAAYLHRRGMYAPAALHLNRAYAAAKELGLAFEQAHILLHLGEMAHKRLDYPEAARYYRQSLSILEDLGQTRFTCMVLWRLGRVAERSRKYAEAQDFLQRGLALARQEGHLEELLDILSTLGNVIEQLGKYAQAQRYYEEALALARWLGDEERICRVLISLAVLSSTQGDRDQALALFEQGLALTKQNNLNGWTCVILFNMCSLAVEQGDIPQAKTLCQEALALARQQPDQGSIISVLEDLAFLYKLQSGCRPALPFYEEALTLARQLVYGDQ